MFTRLSFLPGALSRITGVIAEANANIKEVHRQHAFTNLPVQSADVEFVLKTRNAEHAADIVRKLGEAGFAAQVPEHGR